MQRQGSLLSLLLLLSVLFCLCSTGTHAFLPSSSIGAASRPGSRFVFASQRNDFRAAGATILRESPSTPAINGDEEIPILENDEEILQDNDQEILKDALLQNVLFASLPEESLLALTQAFETTTFNQSDVIIRQGDRVDDDDDYVYVLKEGECTVKRDGAEIPRPYGTLTKNAIFGELELMYNRTRAATVSCKTPTVTVFRIPFADLKQILNQQQDQNDEEIDTTIQQIEGTKSLYDGYIIRPYKPDRSWLWRRFTGTVLQHVAKPALANMLWSAGFVLWAHSRWTRGPFSLKGIGLPPDPHHPFIAKLHMIHKIWCYQQGLTTFILTFFLNQAYTFWMEIYGVGRRIQGRLNDFHLTLATTAARNKKNGTFTAKAESLLDDVGQYSRLFHALLWASQARRFRVLQTSRGLQRMASRGLMTSKQLDVLLHLDMPENQRHNACLEWIMIRTDQGIQDGTLISDPAHRQMLLAKITELRSTYASISDKLAGRMPLAYTHMVQILVDVFVWTAPVALYAELGAWSVICVGILTVFYAGLLDLAKIFLDPLDNEDFCLNSIFMDIGVLIRESNAGSTRWKRGAARLPF